MLTTGASGRPGSVNSPNNENFIVTLTGGGVWTTGGNGDNGSTGIIVNSGTVNLNKSVGSAHSVGGPGLTVNSGGVARITGAGGDQVYDGASVTVSSGATFDLNGNSETIANLAGTGGVVDNAAAGTSATLTLGNGSSTFNGSLRNSGSGASLRLVKSGTGTFVLSEPQSHIRVARNCHRRLYAHTLTSSANIAMPYTNTAGTLGLIANSSTVSLPMSELTFGNGTPTLAFNLGGLRNFTVPLIHDQREFVNEWQCDCERGQHLRNPARILYCNMPRHANGWRQFYPWQHSIGSNHCR